MIKKYAKLALVVAILGLCTFLWARGSYWRNQRDKVEANAANYAAEINGLKRALVDAKGVERVVERVVTKEVEKLVEKKVLVPIVTTEIKTTTKEVQVPATCALPSPPKLAVGGDFVIMATKAGDIHWDGTMWADLTLDKTGPIRTNWYRDELADTRITIDPQLKAAWAAKVASKPRWWPRRACGVGGGVSGHGNAEAILGCVWGW
jgi:hypothetical protein